MPCSWGRLHLASVSGGVHGGVHQARIRDVRGTPDPHRRADLAWLRAVSNGRTWDRTRERSQVPRCGGDLRLANSAQRGSRLVLGGRHRATKPLTPVDSVAVIHRSSS